MIISHKIYDTSLNSCYRDHVLFVCESQFELVGCLIKPALCWGLIGYFNSIMDFITFFISDQQQEIPSGGGKCDKEQKTSTEEDDLP